MASTTTGMLASTAAASIWPYSVWYWPLNSAIAMGAVLIWTRVRMMAKKNSFQASMNANTPAAKSDGSEMGRTTRRKVWSVLAPSTAAARSSWGGMDSKKPFRIQMTTGSVNER
jgi:hypothetical protein